jgi:TctA family transporter
MLISELDAVPIAVAGVAVGEATAVLVLADKQPLIDTRAREQIKSKGSAYLSGVLIYCFIIRVIGFTFHPPYK